jgi:hypothetical protein
MLNLNYNIQNSLLKREIKGFNSFQVRRDPFSGSIVVAIPGSIFKNGLYQDQFNMNGPYDDISSYVKAGPGQNPIGDNLVTYISSSGDGITYPTSSLVKFTDAGSRYSTSLYFNSTASLVVDKLWPAKQGANLTLTSSFTIEAWVAWEQTASNNGQGIYQPNRPLAYKYDPAIPSSSAYLYYNEWGSQQGVVPVISGSSAFVYDFNNPQGGGESITQGTGSLPIVPYTWNHYAVSYTSASATPFSRRLRLYKNGLQLVNRDLTGQPDINQDISEALQIFGGYIEEPLSGDTAGGKPGYLQDFRLYNGTDKNYTASIIPLPQSMVQWPY